MFNRRRTRNVNDSAYTGVANQAPANRTAPNLSALAAAATIGRSQSGQFTQKQAAAKPRPKSQMGVTQKRLNGLLLGRRSLIQLGSGDFAGFTLSGPLNDTRLVYDIDDLMDDAYFDEVTNLTSFNHAQMADLRLSPHEQEAPVKMVKRYIPTLTGVKVVEVPETQINLQIQRCNSVRAGMAIPRSNSMQGSVKRLGLRALSLNSLSYANYKRAEPRTSSLRKQPPTNRSQRRPQSPAERTSSTTLALEQQLHLLQAQIEHERALQEQIARKQQEYEHLKQQRVLQEQHLALMKEIEEEDEPEEVTPVDTTPRQTALDATVDPTTPSQAEAAAIEYPTGQTEALTTPEHSHNTQVTKNAVPAPILTGYVQGISGDEFVSHEPLFGETDPAGLAQQLRPLLGGTESSLGGAHSVASDVPVTSEGYGTRDTLPVPTISAAGGLLGLLIRLGSSGELPLRRPMKLALKNSTLNYTLNLSLLGKSGKPSNAAAGAYLSLETAENTRLNMKLSQQDLLEAIDPQVVPQPPKPQFHPPHQQQQQQQPKRMSLRAPQPPAQEKQRTMRPQLYAEPRQQPGAKMLLRSLRQLTHGAPATGGYVQPIAPHPTLQPGYQLPSKVKAAQLYAKASSRPVSQFGLARKSSFSKENESDPNAGFKAAQNGSVAPPPPKGHNRSLSGSLKITPQQQAQVQARAQANRASAVPQGATTLRANPQQNQQPQQPQQQGKLLTLRNGLSGQNQQQYYNNGSQRAPDGVVPLSGNSGAFKSRFADSDDEDYEPGVAAAASGPSPATGGRGHHMGFGRHQQEQKKPQKTGGFITNNFILPSVRNEEQALAVPFVRALEASSRDGQGSPQKDKKKFGKLRKLFGKSKD